MYLDNYKHIVNTDYSNVIIELMKKRCQHLIDMSWVVMDINNLQYENESFECVLEKGTIDALLVDEKSPWRLSDENEIKIDKILEKVKINEKIKKECNSFKPFFFNFKDIFDIETKWEIYKHNISSATF